MPIVRVQKNGKPGFRYGSRGKVYTYTAGHAKSRLVAKKKAIKQAVAISYSTGRRPDL